MSMRSFVWIACFGWLAACGADQGSVSPREECMATTSALCERIYACYTQAELASVGLPASEAACETMLEASRGCAAQTLQNVCTGNQQYSATEAARCSDQISGLTCSQIRDPFFDEVTAAPACAKVCTVN